MSKILDNTINLQNVLAALQHKSVGSGDINMETCTVTLQHKQLPIGYFYTMAYTKSNGLWIEHQSAISQTTTISNVVCGSVLIISSATPVVAGYSATGGALLMRQERNLWIFSIPQQPTDDIVITLREDD